MIVSYFEWVQGLQNFFWNIGEINRKLHDILKQSFQNVVMYSEKYDVNMKRAAFIGGLARLDKAMRSERAVSIVGTFVPTGRESR